MLFACYCLLLHCFLFPLALFSVLARGQLKDKCTGLRRERVKQRKRKKVSELKGLGQKRNWKAGAECLGSSRALGDY